MFCKNCGKQLPDDAKFCTNCGTPTASPAAPQEPGPSSDDPIKFPGAGFPGDDAPIAEPPAADPSTPEEPPVSEEESPAPEVEAETPAPAESALPAAGASIPVSELTPVSTYTPPEADSGGASPIKRRGKAGLVVLGVGAVVVIAVVVLLVKLLGGLLSGGGKAMYVYRNDDGELMYLADLNEKTKALELTDEADYTSNVAFSPDGKTIYFTDSDRTLYSITTAELKKESKPERISRDVSSFFLLNDGRLVYTQHDSESKLYICEKGESYRLLRGYSDYRFSEDQKTVYYTELDPADNTTSLYKMAVSKDATEEKLLKGATTIYTSYDSDVLVYGVDDNPAHSYVYAGDGSSPDNNTLTVYSCKPGGDKTKLVSDVYSITGVSVDGGKASFYYYIQEAEQRTLYDFVTDSNASADASTLSGDRPVYPSWSDYSPYDYDIADDVTITYFDHRGSQYSLDVSSLLSEEYPTAYEVYMNTWNVEAMADDECRVRYNEAKEDYDSRIDAWNEAQNRDYVRQALKDTQYSQTFFNLYQYTGSDKSDPIATEISTSGRTSSPSNGIFLYHKVSLEGGKVADVADLSYANEVRDMLSSGDGGDEWYQNVGGKESVIDLDDVTTVYSIYVLNGKEVVLDVYDGYDNLLMAFSLGKDALTFTSTIMDEEFSGPHVGRSSNTDVLYLFTDVDYDSYGTVGDLCIYKDGKVETIAKEVYGAAVLNSSGTTYVVTDMDSRGNAELSLLKDGKTSVISDEIDDDFAFLDDTQVLYISDGDLMLWNGKEERRIARDVEEFWASVYEGYMTYSPNY